MLIFNLMSSTWAYLLRYYGKNVFFVVYSDKVGHNIINFDTCFIIVCIDPIVIDKPRFNLKVLYFYVSNINSDSVDSDGY